MKKLLLLSALLIFACSSDSEGNDCIYEPTLSTEAVTDITETSATLNGIIAIVSENCDVALGEMQGFVYSTNPSPTNDDNVEVVYGTDISTTIDNLIPNTTYYVRVFITNSLGEFYGNEMEFTTNLLDTTPPVITIIGDNPLEINVGENYTEFGATAIDDIDGDITQNIIIDSSDVNTALAGIYIVTYSVSDSSNNSTSEQREVVVFDDSQPLNCDGNPIPTIVYGTQEWAIENACHSTYRDGTPIPEATENTPWASLTTGAWCYKNYDPSTNVKMYNWYAVAGIHNAASLSYPSLRKEFAPEGWHVPSNYEYTILENFLIANGYNYDGSTTENKLAKAMASTSGWNSNINTITGTPGNDQSSNNSSGLNFHPFGWRSGNHFTSEGSSVIIWTSSSNSTTYTACYRSITTAQSNTNQSCEGLRKHGFSVRFVRD